MENPLTKQKEQVVNVKNNVQKANLLNLQEKQKKEKAAKLSKEQDSSKNNQQGSNSQNQEQTSEKQEQTQKQGDQQLQQGQGGGGQNAQKKKEKKKKTKESQRPSKKDKKKKSGDVKISYVIDCDKTKRILLYCVEHSINFKESFHCKNDKSYFVTFNNQMMGYIDNENQYLVYQLLYSDMKNVSPKVSTEEKQTRPFRNFKHGLGEIVDMKLLGEQASNQYFGSIGLISSKGNFVQYSLKISKSINHNSVKVVLKEKLDPSPTWRILKFKEKLVICLSEKQIAVVNYESDKPQFNCFQDKKHMFTNFNYNTARDKGYAITKSGLFLEINWDKQKITKTFDMSKVIPGFGVRQVLFFTSTSKTSMFFVLFDNLELRLYTIKKFDKKKGIFPTLFQTQLDFENLWSQEDLSNIKLELIIEDTILQVTFWQKEKELDVFVLIPLNEQFFKDIKDKKKSKQSALDPSYRIYSFTHSPKEHAKFTILNLNKASLKKLFSMNEPQSKLLKLMNDDKYRGRDNKQLALFLHIGNLLYFIKFEINSARLEKNCKKGDFDLMTDAQKLDQLALANDEVKQQVSPKSEKVTSPTNVQKQTNKQVPKNNSQEKVEKQQDTKIAHQKQEKKPVIPIKENQESLNSPQITQKLQNSQGNEKQDGFLTDNNEEIRKTKNTLTESSKEDEQESIKKPTNNQKEQKQEQAPKEITLEDVNKIEDQILNNETLLKETQQFENNNYIVEDLQNMILQQEEMKLEQANALPNLKKQFEILQTDLIANFDQNLSQLTEDISQELGNQVEQINDDLSNSLQNQLDKIFEDQLKKFVKDIDQKIKFEFKKAFEQKVNSVFSTYLSKLFVQVNALFENGFKFYIERLKSDKGKYQIIKNALNEVIDVTKTLIDNAAINQKNLFQLDSIFQEKKQEIIKITDQIQKASSYQESTCQSYEQLVSKIVKISTNITNITKIFKDQREQHSDISQRQLQMTNNQIEQGKLFGKSIQKYQEKLAEMQEKLLPQFIKKEEQDEMKFDSEIQSQQSKPPNLEAPVQQQQQLQNLIAQMQLQQQLQKQQQQQNMNFSGLNQFKGNTMPNMGNLQRQMSGMSLNQPNNMQNNMNYLNMTNSGMNQQNLAPTNSQFTSSDLQEFQLFKNMMQMGKFNN